jgi:membrane protein DedA with SNARE-associated domain
MGSASWSASPPEADMLASILSVAGNIGYPALAVLVMSESAGVPLPGETSLVTAAILAGQGRLQIELVIGIAAAAAIIGDNLGYLIGRSGGRWLLERPGPFLRQRRAVLTTGTPFFERHGPKAVFFGRWLIGLRVWASWLAGGTRMPWRSFAFWNAAGGVAWATTIGLIAFYLGHSAGRAVGVFGLYGVVGLIIIVLGYVLRRRHERRSARDERQSGDPPAGAGPERSSSGPSIRRTPSETPTVC